jgi:hypothetical protein
VGVAGDEWEGRSIVESSRVARSCCARPGGGERGNWEIRAIEGDER